MIGIDQRGHGHSPDGPWALSYRQMADDTATVIEQMKLGRVDVVGHSDGGNVALLLARYYPGLVRRVAISGANIRGLSPQDLTAQNALPKHRFDERFQALAARLPAHFSTDYAAVSPDGKDHWMAMVSKCYSLWSQSVVITPADLKNIGAQVLVIAGDHDLTTLEETGEIFRGLAHGQLMVVPASGHATFLTHADLVNLAISDFLDSPGGP